MKKLLFILLMPFSVFAQTEDTIVGAKRVNLGASTTISLATPTTYLWNTGATTTGDSYLSNNYIYPLVYYYLSGSHGITVAKKYYQSNSISVYPNPNGGIFTVESKEKLGQVKVINMLGQTVYNEKLGTKAEINLNSQPKGVYIVITDKGVSKIVNK